jgi:hypothetical protein
MLRKRYTLLILLCLVSAICASVSTAGGPQFDPCSGDASDSPVGIRGIAKVKPPNASDVLKVRPFSGVASGLGGISNLNPANWWQQCCLPSPAPRQFVLGPRVFFARLRGEARRGWSSTPGAQSSIVDFDEGLQIPKSGHTLWSVEAHYQAQPRWGFRYSFTPILAEGAGLTSTAFTFMGQSFTSGTPIHSKWERYEHRAGFVFDVLKNPSSVTSLFAEWLYIQDKLTVGSPSATLASVTWDADKSLAVLGLELNKCLKNYRGSTLAFNAKGSVAFLDHHIGYDAEAGFNYIIPVKRGRFGFLKGGYRYANLKKERDHQLFRTILDGAFMEVGFLF